MINKESIEKIITCVSNLQNKLKEIIDLNKTIKDKRIQESTAKVLDKLGSINKLIGQCDILIDTKSITTLDNLLNYINNLMNEIYDILKKNDFESDSQYLHSQDIETYKDKRKSLFNNEYSELYNSLNTFFNSIYFQYLDNKISLSNKSNDDLLVDYIYVLSHAEDYNPDASQGSDTQKWNDIYENYCKFLIKYCIAKNEKLNTLIQQGKIGEPEIVFVELGDKINAQLSREDKKIYINYKKLCKETPIMTAVAIRHELEHYYQSVVTNMYNENLETHDDIYSNDVGYIYKSYNQYYKMDTRSIKNIYKFIGDVSISNRGAERIRYAAYSMMKVEHDARRVQSEFDKEIRSLFKTKRPEFVRSIPEIGKKYVPNPINKNKKEYRKHDRTLNDFITFITNNMSGFIDIMPNIDINTLLAIFYAMPLAEKIKLLEKIEVTINGSANQETKSYLELIKERLNESIKYDKQVDEEQKRANFIIESERE